MQGETTRDESAEALDGSTHFVFEHKVFSVEGCFFKAEADTPSFLMPLGDEMAAISLASLRQEFDLGDESNDAKLLDIVAKSLTYVKQIRPNDSIPQEILDGTASWSVEDRHRAAARDRLMIQMVTWLSGREGQGIGLDQIEQLTEDPKIKQQLQEAFGDIAEKLGLGRERKQEVINKIEQLGHEFSYIEGLLERFHTVTDIARKVDRLSKLYGDQNSSCDELSRVKALLQRARSEFGMKFKAVNAQNCEMLTVLRGFDLYVQHIRDTRDDLHHRFMDWDETIKQWQAEEATAPSDEATLLIKQTYHFLAVRFTKTQKWGSVKK
ncbi:MAG: hypothetical protein V3V96_13785 [Acidiferrobacterales bacterium]